MNRSYRIENTGETPIVVMFSAADSERMHVVAPGKTVFFQESLPTDAPLSVSVMPHEVTVEDAAAPAPGLDFEQVKEMVRHEVAHAMGAALKAEDKPKPKPKPRPPKADAK